MMTYPLPRRVTSTARRLAPLGLAVLAGLLASAALLLAAAWPALAAPAAARSYPGEAPCHTTLQACIDGADPGDTIVIQPGTYITSLTLHQAVSLTGVASDTTILHALPDQRVLTVTGAAISNTVVISGLTFTGGDIDFNFIPCQTHCGGGVLITGTAQPLLANLIITGNEAAIGGGVFANNGSPLRLVNTHVIGNRSQNDGGGVYAVEASVLEGGLIYANRCGQPGCRGGGLAAYGGLTLTATHVISNAANGGIGAGVYVEGGAVLHGGLLAQNRCDFGACQGGGLYVSGAAALTGTHFIDNFALWTAAGAYLFGDASLHNVLFQGNECPTYSCNGGALRMSGDLSLSASQFVSNTSALNGGGLYLSSGNAHITNTLFANNNAGFGPAIFLDSPGNVTIVHATLAAPAQVVTPALRIDDGNVAVYNTLFANHAIGLQRNAGTAVEDYNLFAGVPTPTQGSVSSGGNSLTGEAGFADAAGGNYHLGPASDAIDAGSDQAVAVDYDGQPRPIGLGFDIGFDEFAALFMPLVHRSQ